jgi:hypothetical protein
MIDVTWLEAAGLFLVLVSSFKKLFLSDKVSDINRGVLQMRQEEKIDNLWMLLTLLTRHVYPASSKVLSQWYDLDGTAKSWKYANPATEADRQAKTFKSAGRLAERRSLRGFGRAAD